MSDFTVHVWEEKVNIPTYGIGKPDRNPMFFEKRVYQGSSGAVYPNPIIEKIYDEKQEAEYKGLFLENRYLKIMILPELGGRVQMAYDKIKKRHFIYYNQVIKPALVGLTGPWISGGIEFNWPQHHRPSTFEPVDYKIEENKDGSKTVWINEVEKMFRTKGMAGFTLHPDKAYLEINVKLYNRTAFPQTFLWWANPAVKVNDDYQSVFPPDVNAVFDHGKRDVSSFPIATGTYYKVDYSRGIDISRYKNIPVPTSYMAINSQYDFMGGYEHDTRAGVLHVANRHVSPGKKQWTWGHSDFGQAWDRNLTDEDGPYIELMAGVFTDNQPDFSWLMPYEEKTFTQYFLPYRELGLVKNASKDILLSVERENLSLRFKLFATSIQKNLVLICKAKGDLICRETLSVDPENVFEISIPIHFPLHEDDLVILILDAQEKQLLRYEAALNRGRELPKPAEAALKPFEIKSNEQLFLTGQHLEQYRHATFHPLDYYEEALKRDPRDSRCNNATGLWYLRRGKFEKAIGYFEKAIETLTSRNPNPYDSEPYYNVGIALRYLGKNDKAYDAFYKATWCSGCQDIAFFSLAQIDLLNGETDRALDLIKKAIDRNANNGKAYVLQSAALRKAGKYKEALQVCDVALQRDIFNIGALLEQVLIFESLNRSADAERSLCELLNRSRSNTHTLTEYALDLTAAGLYPEAIRLIKYIPEEDRSPIICYHLAYFYGKAGNLDEMNIFLAKAAKADPYLCFPHRLEDILALTFAIDHNRNDGMAYYYLGNLWYDKRQYKDAITCWEKSIELKSDFPTSYRNLAIAYFNIEGREDAVHYFEKAFALDTSDARVLMELDQLYKRLNKDPDERLKFIEAHLPTALDRDDVYLERASIYNFNGDHQKAYELIMNRKFHPWEGGEGKVSGQYILSLVELAKCKLHEGNFDEAIKLLDRAQIYPHNLGEGKLYGAQENDVFYWLGCAYQGKGEDDRAIKYFELATKGLSEPGAAIFYNDQQPDKIFYQGLAWQRLQQQKKAYSIFEKLAAYGEKHMNDNVQLDYFAVSLPHLLIFNDDLTLRNRIHCYYISALGYAGLGEIEKSKALFIKVLEMDKMHFGAKIHFNLLEKGIEGVTLNA